MTATATLLPNVTYHWDTTDPDPTIAHSRMATDDGATTNAGMVADGGYIEVGMTAMPEALGIASYSLKGKYRSSAAAGHIRQYLKIAGTRYYGSNHTPYGSYGEFADTWSANPATDDAFTVGVLNSMRVGWVLTWDTGDEANIDCTYLPAEVAYEPLPAEVDAARDVASRRIWVRRRTSGRVIIRGGPRLLDFRPGDRVELAHLAGPHATGEGWEAQDYARRPLWVERVDWNPADMTVTLGCIDHRPKLCLMYDSGFGTVPGAARDGLMRLSPGAIWTMARSSSAEMLADTGQLVSVQSDVEALAARGQIIQGARTNYLLNSAWSLGVDTSWTSSGEGSNGSNITEDLTEGLWPIDVTTRSLKILGGTPAHAADLQHAAAAVTGRTGLHSVQVWHKDTGGALSVALQRSIDSKWYRASDSTWQASKTWNALTQRSDWARDVIRNINVGASSTSLTLYLGVPSASAVSGQHHRVAHAGLADGAYPCSPIQTTDATKTRALDTLEVENNSGARTLSASQFTLSFEVEPFWSSSELTAGATPTVCYAYHDASNFLWLYFDQTSAKWTAALRVAGTTYTAQAAATPAEGTRYTVTVRFVGSRGELGKTPYTLEVLVDGVVGSTTAVASGPMTEASTSALQIGHKAGASQFDGYIRQRFSSPQVLTDVEISRGI